MGKYNYEDEKMDIEEDNNIQVQIKKKVLKKKKIVKSYRQ